MSLKPSFPTYMPGLPARSQSAVALSRSSYYVQPIASYFEFINVSPTSDDRSTNVLGRLASVLLVGDGQLNLDLRGNSPLGETALLERFLLRLATKA